MSKLHTDLQPVFQQLRNEGKEVYTYTPSIGEVKSLFWFENGRVLNIQPDTMRGFNLSVSYVPSVQNGSGCQLSEDYGMRAEDVLKFRNAATWVSGVTHYKNMAQFLKGQTVLKWFELTDENTK